MSYETQNDYDMPENQGGDSAGFSDYGSDANDDYGIDNQGYTQDTSGTKSNKTVLAVVGVILIAVIGIVAATGCKKSDSKSASTKLSRSSNSKPSFLSSNAEEDTDDADAEDVGCENGVGAWIEAHTCESVGIAVGGLVVLVGGVVGACYCLGCCGGNNGGAAPQPGGGRTWDNMSDQFQCADQQGNPIAGLGCVITSCGNNHDLMLRLVKSGSGGFAYQSQGTRVTVNVGVAPSGATVRSPVSFTCGKPQFSELCALAKSIPQGSGEQWNILWQEGSRSQWGSCTISHDKLHDDCAENLASGAGFVNTIRSSTTGGISCNGFSTWHW